MTEIKALAKYEAPVVAAKQGFMAVAKDEQLWLKELGFALQIVRGNTTLQQCDPESTEKTESKRWQIATPEEDLNQGFNSVFLERKERITG